MCFLLRVIALLLLLAAPAAAQEIVIGRGAICDTQKQIERLITLLDRGAEAAIESVNAEENDPTACAVATVAFVEGPEIAIYTELKEMRGVFATLPVADSAQVLVNLGLVHRDNEWQPYWQAWLDCPPTRGGSRIKRSRPLLTANINVMTVVPESD